MAFFEELNGILGVQGKVLMKPFHQFGAKALERLVSTAREQARQHTYKCIEHLLSDERKNFLDQLLVIDEEKKKTLLTWLRQRAVSSSPESIRTTLDKLTFLVKAGVPEWDLSMLSSNRLQFLNRLGKCSTNQALQRSSMQKRCSILMGVVGVLTVLKV